MKHYFISGLLASTLACTFTIAESFAEASAPLPPVAAKKSHRVESLNGTREDLYYWLRDDTREAPEVLDYLNRENAYRDAVMAPTAALQQKLYTELVGRIDPNDASVPVFEHGYWYYERFVPGLDYPLYVRRRASMTAPEQVMLDGNAMAAGHSYFQIGAAVVSPDRQWIAYTVDDIGRRQHTLKIKNIDSGVVLADTVTHVEPEVVWAADSKTLLYVENDPVTLLSVRVHAHRLGSRAADDPLVYEEKDHSFYVDVRKSRSEKYLFIEVRSTQQSEWLYSDAADPLLGFQPVLPREPNHQYDVEHLGRDFVIRTNWQAPNFRMVRTPIATSVNKATWKDVIPQRNDAFIQDFEVSLDNLVVNERSGGLLKLRVKAWKAGRDIVLDSSESSYAMLLQHTPGMRGRSLRYIYTSLTTPETTYDYDVQSHRKQVRKTDAVSGGFEAANYATDFLQAPARDGKRIPVSIAYRRGTRLDGTAPIYQYAYGAYGDSTDPIFQPDWVSLLDRGFVVAIAHIRGGQELGRQWFEDGRLLRKKNSFTDFIDVTRFLVQHRYGAKDKVFAQGLSAGGLLMGAVANMAPLDYRAIIAHVPFVDAVTTMLDTSIPLTSNEFEEWGNPLLKPYYEYILSYSPYDNVAAHDYPAMLVSTSLWDSQVQYYEPTKWVAKLRAYKTDHNPLIFSVNLSGGHGGKSGRFQSCRDTALEYAFMLSLIGVER